MMRWREISLLISFDGSRISQRFSVELNYGRLEWTFTPSNSVASLQFHHHHHRYHEIWYTKFTNNFHKVPKAAGYSSLSLHLLMMCALRCEEKLFRINRMWEKLLPFRLFGFSEKSREKYEIEFRWNIFTYFRFMFPILPFSHHSHNKESREKRRNTFCFEFWFRWCIGKLNSLRNHASVHNLLSFITLTSSDWNEIDSMETEGSVTRSSPWNQFRVTASHHHARFHLTYSIHH